MSRSILIIICALILVLGLSLSAKAEVQNVSVGGDLMVRGIWQRDYDLNSSIRGNGNDVPVAIFNGAGGAVLGSAAGSEIWGSCLTETLNNGAWTIAGAQNDFYRPEYQLAGAPRRFPINLANQWSLGINTRQMIVTSILDERRGTSNVNGRGLGVANTYNPENLTVRRLDTPNTDTADDASVVDWFDSTALVWVASDLTDNVNAYISFLNERNWDVMNAAREDVVIEKAYLTLAEMYGYPVDLSIGRQDIVLGEGFLVGDGYRQGFNYDNDNEDYKGAATTAFDAIRFTWNYDPHQVDVVIAKIDEEYEEQAANLMGDEDLYAINWNYDGGVYGVWDFGLYWTHQKVQGQSIQNANVDPNVAAGTWNIYGTNNVGGTWDNAVTVENAACRRAPNGPTDGKVWAGDNNTAALTVRGEGDAPWVTVGTLSMKGELVKQWGTVATVPYALIQDPNNPTDLLIEGKSRRRSAWGGYAEAEYTFESFCQPYIGVGYTHLSGDNNNSKSVLENSGALETFDPMCGDYGDKCGEIADQVYGGMTDNRPWAGQMDGAVTNANIWKLGVGFNPTENLLIDLSYFSLRQDQAEYNVLEQKTVSRVIGNEFDFSLAYDYTEDVSFGFLYAVFNPGGYWEDALLSSDFDDQAREVLASVAISF